VLAPFLFVASACSASVRFATASVRWIDGGVCLQRVQNALDWRQGGGNGRKGQNSVRTADRMPDAPVSSSPLFSLSSLGWRVAKYGVFLDHHFSTWAVAGPSLDRALKCAYVTMNSLLDCFDAKELSFPREKITYWIFLIFLWNIQVFFCFGNVLDCSGTFLDVPYNVYGCSSDKSIFSKKHSAYTILCCEWNIIDCLVFI
jgi:hypothetical protein